VIGSFFIYNEMGELKCKLAVFFSSIILTTIDM